MRGAILVFCVGIASGVFVLEVPRYLTLSLYAGFLIAVLVLLLYACGRQGWYLRTLVGALLFLMGLAWHLSWASSQLDARLPPSLEGQDLRIEGVVIGLPERSTIAQQFQFRVLQADSGFPPRKVALNYYGDASIEPGQCWRFTVRLNRPHGFANPGGFDYEAWLMQQGIDARGYVRQAESNRLLPPGLSCDGGVPGLWLHSLRYSLKKRLEAFLADAPHGGLLIALVLGDRSAITQKEWRLFTATGSNHLFVISGLHIGLIAAVCYFISTLFAKVLVVGKLVPAQKFAAGIALSAAFAYALLAGFTLPTQRAFIMLAVLICGQFWNVRYLISFRLLLAALVVLLLNPLAVVSSGFWLSFVAVAALLAFVDTGRPMAEGVFQHRSLRDRVKTRTLQLIRPQLIVLAALAAPLLVFNGGLSLLAPVVNLVAIPVVGFVIVPLCFISLFLGLVYEPLGIAGLALAHESVRYLMVFIESLAEWGVKGVQLQYGQLSLLQLVALCIAALLLLLPRIGFHRALVIPLGLFLLLPQRELEGQLLRIHILDVGQGLSVIVQTQNHTLLYDSGAELSPDFNIGSAVVAPALRALGIKRLDAVVISHNDNDHVGGLSGLLQHVDTDRLIGNAETIGHGETATRCDGAPEWQWDGVTFRFLQTRLDYDSENDNSCVLQVRFNEAAILLPGDIERAAERELVLSYGSELASTIVVAPHHGSLSSSSYSLLKQVRPDYVVFSSGYRNSFGHPHPQVVTRYIEFSSLGLTTAVTGMIGFEFPGDQGEKGITGEVTLYREQNRRYWR